MGELVLKIQTIPSWPELLSRYQSSLGNDLIEALKALREPMPGGPPGPSLQPRP